MGIKFKHTVFCAVLVLCSLGGFAQMTEHPPEPRMDHGGPHNPQPCNEDIGGTPPPVGLCLPINDYVYPLLVLGVLLGGYTLHKFEAKA